MVEKSLSAGRAWRLCCAQVGEEGAYTILNGFGTVINSLGQRAKPYLPQVGSRPALFSEL